ncbi:MAG: hypothetical protein GWP27_04435 [Bacteroidetes bacterium]|nr:hypothetical protein [Bacteroidota bacterium]
MRISRHIFSTILLTILAHAAFAQCVQTVNFGSWKRTGDSSYVGNNGWIVSGGGTILSSNQNNNYPRMYVGPDTLINVRVTGTFEVQTYSDDDYIGFVLVLSRLGIKHGTERRICFMSTISLIGRKTTRLGADTRHSKGSV